jgi:hypothetical protein
VIGEVDENVIDIRPFFWEEDPSEPSGVVSNNSEILIFLKAGRKIVRIA